MGQNSNWNLRFIDQKKKGEILLVVAHIILQLSSFKLLGLVPLSILYR